MLFSTPRCTPTIPADAKIGYLQALLPPEKKQRWYSAHPSLCQNDRQIPTIDFGDVWRGSKTFNVLIGHPDQNTAVVNTNRRRNRASSPDYLLHLLCRYNVFRKTQTMSNNI